MSPADALPGTTPEPGTEPNLHLLDCLRCGEPMYHLFYLEAEYPLCLWWAFTCGECGHRVDAWEDKDTLWRPQTGQEPGDEEKEEEEAETNENELDEDELDEDELDEETDENP